MHLINSEALTNSTALIHARRVDLDTKAGLDFRESIRRRQVPTTLVSQVTDIIKAIAAGWFEIPRGVDLTFSKDQHGRLRQMAARAPWLIEIQSEASAFEEFRLQFASDRGNSFGVKPIPDVGKEAAAVSNRLSRLPLEHAAGEITVEIWVQILRDTQSRAEQIRGMIQCLSLEWMWNPHYPLEQQVERLRQFDCMHLLAEYISGTRNRHLDRFEVKLLDAVKHRHLPVTEYEERLAAEHKRRDDEARASWLTNFELIRRLAGILDGLTTYHQATVSRRLNQESNGQFRLQRSSMNGALAIEIRYQYEVGHTYKFETAFLLVNYCLALADEIENLDPVFERYLEACDRAYGRVKVLEAAEQDGHRQPAKRRPDDIEGEAA
ncbi:hypothetical protein [Pseudomonas baetica]|uniref:hypothetical protein n=1 Tax=Pseudomonas baetica TaxID=674054 RepID=UPI002405AC5A|nr:hypothetical protein [Pseudomonas baetica]MDF9778838.1 hypothetical protein [Pseudomonas baetica]